jgi:hypothetical protein
VPKTSVVYVTDETGGATTPGASAAQVTLIPRLGRRPAVGSVITKDLYTYSIKILRQEKTIRDLGREAVRERYGSAF